MAQHSHHAQQEKGAGDKQKFGLPEGYEARNQDPRGNSSQGTKQWIFQGRLIVAGGAEVTREQALRVPSRRERSGPDVNLFYSQSRRIAAITRGLRRP